MSQRNAAQLGGVVALLLTIPHVAPAQARTIDRSKLNSMLRGVERVVVTDGASSAPVPSAAPTVTLQRDDMLAARVRLASVRDTRNLVLPPPVVGRTIADTAIVLPIRLVKFTPAGEPKWVLRPLVLIENGGMRYDAAVRRYRGSFLLGVEDSIETQPKPLANSVSFAITANPGEVDPSQPAMARLNADFQRVTITTEDAADSVTLAVRPSFLREVVEFKIPVRRTKVDLTVSTPSIRGFGLQATQVMLDVPLAGVEGTPITLTSDRGTVEPNPIVLDAQGRGRATLRSDGVGDARLRVTNAGFASTPTSVHFAFPVFFLSAAILGGIAGTFAHNRRPPRRKRSFDTADALTGGLVGVVAAVAYAVGVKLIDVDVSVPFGSEATVFVIAFLVALAWPTLVGVLSKGERLAPSS